MAVNYGTHEHRFAATAWFGTEGMKVSWGGVFAGVLVAMGVSMLLAALGVAIGVSAVEPGETAELERLAGPETRTIDAGEFFVTPGLVNSHIHLESCYDKGLLDDLPVVTSDIIDPSARRAASAGAGTAHRSTKEPPS